MKIIKVILIEKRARLTRTTPPGKEHANQAGAASTLHLACSENHKGPFTILSKQYTFRSHPTRQKNLNSTTARLSNQPPSQLTGSCKKNSKDRLLGEEVKAEEQRRDSLFWPPFRSTKMNF